MGRTTSGRRGRARVLMAIAGIVAWTVVGAGEAGAATAAARPGLAAGSRPDIVVLMLDDVAADVMPRLLDRLPTLRSLFRDHGTRFPEATAEDPLCCPARASFLTGLRSQHHGVHENEGWRFDPRVTVATSLRAAGYHTMITGKYLNGVERLRDRTPPGWDRVAIFSGGYRHYTLFVGGRAVHHGGATRDYSTDVLARQSLAWLRSAPRGRPRFALLTPYATHGDPAAGSRLPTPAARHRGDRRCRGIGFRRTPAWNEADMADRARWVRRLTDITRLPELDDRGWPLARACESLLSVDEWMTGVVRIQRAQGRLDRTLFVLVGDNGMAWGDHRHPGKSVPWATPIPLYLHWPDGLGTAPATAALPVQGLDLAPTFVELAGAHLAGFATGPARPDGRSILPWLRSPATAGPVPAAGYEEHRSRFPRLRWVAMRTSAAHACGRWHYTEWVDGDVELFDLARDPWELRNVARTRPALTRRLHAELARLAHGRQPAGATCPEVVGDGPAGDAAGAHRLQPVDGGARGPASVDARAATLR